MELEGGTSIINTEFRAKGYPLAGKNEWPTLSSLGNGNRHGISKRVFPTNSKIKVRRLASTGRYYSVRVMVDQAFYQTNCKKGSDRGPNPSQETFQIEENVYQLASYEQLLVNNAGVGLKD